MNDKKFAVIVHATDENAVKEAVASLQKLKIPDGFTLDFLPVQGEKKYGAYNFAMTQNDAKYKIYMDEKIIIRQENILSELLKIFKANENIGLIGCSGAVQLSTHGICLNSAKRCGKMQMSSGRNLNEWGAIDKDFREVEAVDGWFIATQYDLKWREEFEFLADTAHCMEFRRQNYKVVVVRQKKPWLWYKSNTWNISAESQQKFLNEYSAELFPLVSIVIPTYNRPKLLREALESALNQTYRHFEIAISDNSKNDDTKKMLQPYLEKYPFIKYFYHENFNANDNWNFARSYNNPDAEYINWLLDDDLFYPRKLEIMVEIFRNNPDVSIVTSVRNTIDKNGNVTGRMLMPRPQILDKDVKLKGEDAGKMVFAIGKNYVGEPTTPLIKKKCLRDNDLCWTAEEGGFYPLLDLSTWLQLFTTGNLFYIANEPLSAFRRHDEQASNWTDSGVAFETCWAKLIKTSWEKKAFHKTEKDIRNQVLNWIYSAINRLTQREAAGVYNENSVLLEKNITAMSQALYNGFQFNLPDRNFAACSADGNNIFG